MEIVLKRITKQAKNGYLMSSPQLRLTAYGASEELASKNLERMALLYLKPFEREGRLAEEIALAGLVTEANTHELTVRLAS